MFAYVICVVLVNLSNILIISAKEDEQEKVQKAFDKMWDKIHTTGHWSSWSEWKCDALCGNGILIRKRVCIGSGEFGIPVCEGSTIDRDGANCSVSCPPMEYFKARIFGQRLTRPEQLFYDQLLAKSEAVSYRKKVGDTIQFNCDYENNKQILINYTGSALLWKKNEELIFYDIRRMKVEKFSNLIMSNLTTNDSGVYTCNIIIPKNTTVTIAIFPLQVLNKTFGLSVRANNKIHLKCNSEAIAKVYKDLHVKWIMEENGTVIKSYRLKRKTKTKFDIIADLKEEYTGLWICSVSDYVMNKTWITNAIRVQVLPSEWVVIIYLTSKFSMLAIGLVGGTFSLIIFVTIIIAIFVERQGRAELLAELNYTLKICDELQSLENERQTAAEIAGLQTEPESTDAHSEEVKKSSDDLENFENQVKKKVVEISNFRKMKAVSEKFYRRRTKK